MKKKKLVLGLLVLMLLFIGIKYCAGQTSAGKLKEGDLIFHTSKSEQSPLIQYATMSAQSHCGIIIEKSDGLYVLEATGKLKLTPLQEFMSGLKGQQAHSPRQRLGYQDVHNRPVGA